MLDLEMLEFVLRFFIHTYKTTGKTFLTLYNVIASLKMCIYLASGKFKNDAHVLVVDKYALIHYCG